MNNEILKFLLGEVPIDGVWFGEKHPAYEGNFWWRNHLRQYMEKQAQLQQHSVSGKQLPLDFVKWYSGMEKTKILKAFDKWSKEVACASSAVDTVAEAQDFYCADWNRCGAICEEQCPACKKTDLCEAPSGG